VRQAPVAVIFLKRSSDENKCGFCKREEDDLKNAKEIETKIATFLAITNEAEVLSKIRAYAESLTKEEFEYAREYAEDFLAKRSAAVEEAFTEAAR
jgi:glutaredoxin-related protein